MSQQAFVTGSGGFVGRHLVARLVAEGWQVNALVRTPQAAAGVTELGARAVLGDLMVPGGQWTNGIAREGVVFHLAAAMTTLPIGVEAGRSMAVNLIAGMTSAGSRRLIAVSSAAVHGPHPALVPVDERSPTGPHPLWNHYVRQKIVVEEVLRAASEGGALWATILRPTRVIGPGDASLIKFVTRLETSIAGGLAGDSACRHPVVAVNDLVAGLVTSATTNATAGKTYYLSSARQITKQWLIDAFVRAGMPIARRSPLKSAVVKPVRTTLSMVDAPWRITRRQASGPRAAVVELLERRAGRPVDHDCTISCARAASDFGWTGSADLDNAIADAVRWELGARSRSSEPAASPS